MNLDHFVIGIDSLDLGYAWAEQALGISLQAGGSHEERGTCNALAGISGGCYLEVVARDVDQLAASVLNLPAAEPKLLHWCIRSDDLEGLEQHAIGLGLSSMGISDWQRQTPSGDRLRWKLLFLGGVDKAGVLPFFIDWCDTRPPSLSLPDQAAATSFRVSAPGAAVLKQLVGGLDVDVEIRESDQSDLQLTLLSRDGRSVELCSDDAFMGGLLGVVSAPTR